MGKVLKIVGTAVAFVGLAVATVATFGGAAALAGALSITTATLGTITTALTIGGGVLMTVGGALAKGPVLEDSGSTARNRTIVDPNALGAYVFGTTALPSVLVFEQNHGASLEFLTAVEAHAWHKIDAFVSLTVDGEAVSFSGDNATGDYAGILTWKRKTGAPGQTALSLSGTVWSAGAKGLGMAHSALTWNFKDQTKFPGGIPSNITRVARGALLYDPRLDTTVGGSGSHRFDDPTTWTFNNGNAALVALRYLIGEYIEGDSAASGARPIWGVGDLADEIDLASFIAAANICDETRDGVPRYRLGGAFATSNDHAAFIQQWEASTGGKISRIAGLRYCWVPHDDLTSFDTLTEKDIIAKAGVTVRMARDVREVYNTARGRYVAAAELYQGAIYPEVSEASALADDGRQRILTVDFPWVQDVSTCERLARYAVRRSRFGRVWKLAVDWRGLLYAPFTVLTINLPSTNDEDQLVRITHMTISLEGFCVLTLEEEDASIYDETMDLGTPPTPAVIPDRRDRLSTLTPRYADGTGIDALVSDASNKRLAPGVVKETSGGSPRVIPVGAAEGVAFDGVAVTFSTAWPAPPMIRFGAGGKTNDPALGAGAQQQVYKANSLSTSGFTPSLRLTASSTSVPQTDGPGSFVGGTPGWQIEKEIADQDKNDSYALKFTVNAADCEMPIGEPHDGYVNVGGYSRTTAGGLWTKRGEVNYTTSGAKTMVINVDGLGVDAAFGVHEESTAICVANGITAFAEVTYDTGVLGGNVSATPAGYEGVPYFLIGDKQPV